MTHKISHWINNKKILPHHEKFFPVYNPATGEVSKQVAAADSVLVDEAVAAAQKAFPAWANTPVAKRAKIMFKFKELIEKNINEISRLVSEEHGKLLDDAKGSVLRGLEVVELACGVPYLMRGWFSENVATDMDCYTIRQALGVCVGITPFNFPAMIPLWMFPMALVCGNTFILKPSEKDPSCPLKLVELAAEAGVPEGVLNLVNGDKTAVDALLTHADVRAVSFVGSSHVAKYIHETAIAHGKRAQAFGSAKNHAVVMPDVNIDQTAQALAGAAYGSAGERCMALSVAVVVGDELADQLVKKLIPLTQQVKLGALDDPSADMGPLYCAPHRDKVKNYIELGVQEGAKLLVDGRKIRCEKYPEGFYLGASLFDHVTSKMKIYQEEIFGPVLCLVRVKNLDEALTLINEHAYGNGTCIFTRDGDSARYFSNRVQVGMVGINVPIPVPAAFHAFGGWKNSIFGDVQMHGSESMQFYTKLKTITARWPKGLRETNAFMMPTHD